MAKSLKKFFNNLGGLNLRSPELLKGDTYATDLRNVEFSENFSITKRRGYQTLLEGYGSCGSVTYNQTDIATGTQTVERLLIDEELRRVVTNTIEISYSGTASAQHAVQLNPDDGNFYLYLYEDGGVSQAINLGTGKEGAPVTIADALSSITGDFSGSTSGTDTGPAAFIKSTERVDVSEDLEFYTVETVNSPATEPFSDLFDNIDEEDFEPASTVQAHQVIYLTSDKMGLWKYDGTNLVRAGLPTPVLSSTDEDTDATDQWVYIAEFQYTDAKENTTYSTRSNEIVVSKADAPIDLSVAAINNSDGYDADNITVNLYRTIENGTQFYLIDSASSVSGSSTDFTDSEDDTDIATNTVYTIPDRNATPPPSCRYISVWRNQLVLTGNPEAVQTVYLANTLDIEGFDFRNSFDTSSSLGGSNSGIKSLDNFLYIFRAHSVAVATGYPDDGTLVVDTMSDEGIGALSHASLVEANNQIFFVSRRGIYSVAGNKMAYKSDIIQPVFNNVQFRENRIQSFHYLYENKVAFLLPVYGENGVDMASNYVLIYDKVSNSWAIWDNMDFSCGLNLDQQDTWFVSNDSGTFYYNETLNTDSLLDYADHDQPVTAYYKSHWESAGEPSIPKKYTKIKVFALDTDFRNFGTTDFTLNMETNHNFALDAATTFDMDFGADVEGWGISAWGDFSWGDSIRLTSVSRLRSTRLQSIRIVFRNSTRHENILISGFELEYAPQYVSRLRGTR